MYPLCITKGFGHYAKHTRKAVKNTVNTLIAAATILSIVSASDIQAQNNFKNTNAEITETGYGNLFIKDGNDQGVAGATVTWTPVSIPGDSIPDPYIYTTNYEGVIDYEVLVFHDSSVGITNDYNLKVVQARPNPSTDFTFNFISNQRPDSPVQIVNLEGKTVGEYNLTNYDNHIAVYHVDLSDKANGIYLATALIDGKAQISKIVKIDDNYVGNLGSSAKKIPNNFKAVMSDTAVYKLTIEAEGYYPLTDSARKVAEGDNGNDFYQLSEIIPYTINNLDIEGYVWELENTSIPLENAQIKVTVNSTGEEYNTISDSTGHFIINELPLNKDITFDVGGITGRYSFTGINFTTPQEITNPEDSVNSNFSAVLPLKLASSSAQHIRDQTRNGTNQDTIWYYQGDTFSAFQKNNNRNKFANLQADENNVYIYAESFTPLNNTGINIEFGTYNTNTTEDAIQSPLGQTLYPIMYANTTMAGAGMEYYVQFVHEIKRALGFDEVAWSGVESVMETPVQNYTQEDKDIAEFVERPYWNAVYQEEKTWIDLNNVAEDMNSKFSNSHNSNKDLNN